GGRGSERGRPRLERQGEGLTLIGGRLGRGNWRTAGATVCRDRQEPTRPDTRGAGPPDEDRAGHRGAQALAASARARRRSADEGAPGSWWPIDRSPRYEARPFVASIGMVAVAPASAAVAMTAAISAGPTPAPNAARPAAAAGTRASSIVFSPVVALPSDSMPPMPA